MIDEQAKARLVSDFPELEDEGMIPQREVFAHFGLLFHGFALLEHELINIVTFARQGQDYRAGKLSDEVHWEKSFDRQFDAVKMYSFGNLVEATCKIREYREYQSELLDLVGYRNYLAHHFFREDTLLIGDDDGCWKVLLELDNVRRRVQEIEVGLRPIFDKMCDRLGMPRPNSTQMDQLIDEMKMEAHEQWRTEGPSMGWKPYLKRS